MVGGQGNWRFWSGRWQNRGHSVLAGGGEASFWEASCRRSAAEREKAARVGACAGPARLHPYHATFFPVSPYMKLAGRPQRGRPTRIRDSQDQHSAAFCGIAVGCTNSKCCAKSEYRLILPACRVASRTGDWPFGRCQARTFASARAYLTSLGLPPLGGLAATWIQPNRCSAALDVRDCSRGRATRLPANPIPVVVVVSAGRQRDSRFRRCAVIDYLPVYSRQRIVEA